MTTNLQQIARQVSLINRQIFCNKGGRGMKLEKLYGEISELVARLQGLRTRIYVEVIHSTPESVAIAMPKLIKDLSVVESKIKAILEESEAYEI